MTFDQRRWDGAHRAVEQSPALEAIRRTTLTAALPPGVQATTVWPSWPLGRLAAELRIAAGHVLLDVACGVGDVGRWIAASVGASVVGVEPSPVGRRVAEARAAASGARARYADGTFGGLGVGVGVADAALIVDALQFAPDQPAALRDLAPAVKAGGRIVIVGPDPSQWASVEAAGLRVVVREETPGWREATEAFQVAIAAQEEVLRAELGDASVTQLLSLPKAYADGRAWHGLVVAGR